VGFVECPTRTSDAVGATLAGYDLACVPSRRALYLLWADKTVWKDLQVLAESGLKSRPKNETADPFTVPKPQRVEIAIATLEQLLEETDDETIREALLRRLEQLREERKQIRRTSN